MTAAWRLVSSDPWSQRTRNPAFPLAVLAHLAVLGALGITSFLRVAPMPPQDIPAPAIVWTVLPPPPLIPLFVEPEPPQYDVTIPRGDTLTAPALPREKLAPDALPDLAGPPPLDGFGELPNLSQLAGAGSGDGPGNPDGRPEGSGTHPGYPDGGEDASPLPLGGGVTRPVLLHKVEPEYPAIARPARLEGRVVLQAVIARDGTVEDVEIVHSTSRVFDEAALEAVRRWRYTPALLNGRAVRVVFRVNVEFVLE